MRVWHGVTLAAAVALAGAVLLTTPAGAAPMGKTETAGISWGRAEALHGRPGDSYIRLYALSCWSANNCVAGGWFATGSNNFSSDYVLVERSDRWSKAEPLPGMAKLGDGASVKAVSCAAGGYCVAGGSYHQIKGQNEPFLSTLKDGRWQAPVRVRGSAVPHHSADIGTVSCLAARRCVAAGDNDLGAFVTWQVNSVWRAAKVFTGIGGGFTVMSCSSALSCVVARLLVISEVDGAWSTPTAIPGADGYVSAVSCARDGYCVVGGSNAAGAFVASGTSTTWNTAVTWPVSGVAALSCPSAGNCTAVGSSWVASETNGTWGAPEQLPGAAASVSITSVSCWSAGSCGVGGSYVASSGSRTEPFVASEIGGRWSTPEPVPGITALNKRNTAYATVTHVSCPAPRQCTAAGTYYNAHDQQLAFVTGPT